MPQTILIADRDSECLDLVSRFLNRYEYDVVTACDGVQCLDKWRELELDVLILETGILWGGCDGVIEVIRESVTDVQEEAISEANGKPIKVPVILMTTDEIENGDFVSDVAAVLRKPFQLSLLLEHIARSTSNRMSATEGFLAGQRQQ